MIDKSFCEVPGCRNSALYIDMLGIYCSIHTDGKAPNIANWILYLGLEMGLDIIEHKVVEWDNGY